MDIFQQSLGRWAAHKMGIPTFSMIADEVRRRLEEGEERLSPLAMKSRLSRGREKPEEPSPLRTAFQRDRDRITYCKAFRRLKHKTQVFISPPGDHYVTRLTHTLQVSQISRSICRALNLNEDLAEAIALGHDLGHTPFGHAGEETLAELLPEGFRHNEQSLRVVDILENQGQGLNLTWEVREGILKHSKTRVGILGEGWENPATLEAQVCKIADSIAYINHDIDDAIRAGLITEEELPAPAIAILGDTHSRRINSLVWNVIQSSWSVTGLIPDIAPEIRMSPPVREAAENLRQFLFQRVYEAPSVTEQTQRAGQVVRHLFEYFVRFPERLPPEYALRGDSAERQAADYTAGMTDRFALKVAEESGLETASAFGGIF